MEKLAVYLGCRTLGFGLRRNGRLLLATAGLLVLHILCKVSSTPTPKAKSRRPSWMQVPITPETETPLPDTAPPAKLSGAVIIGQNFRLGHRIGRGNFGEVRIGNDNLSLSLDRYVFMSINYMLAELNKQTF